MKTKLLLLILVVLIANIAWAEEDWDNAIKITWEKLYNDQALRVIYGGELEFLQRKEPLNELYLSILDQKQLRILRNTIFAQYGRFSIPRTLIYTLPDSAGINRSLTT